MMRYVTYILVCIYIYISRISYITYYRQSQQKRAYCVNTHVHVPLYCSLPACETSLAFPWAFTLLSFLHQGFHFLKIKMCMLRSNLALCRYTHIDLHLGMTRIVFLNLKICESPN